MASAAQIRIYLPDDSELPKWLDWLKEQGFREIDWCEMRSPDDTARIDYAPCETTADPYAGWDST